MRKVVIKFSSMSQKSLAEIAGHIVATMSINTATFPSPNPSLDKITHLNGVFINAVESPEHPGKTGEIHNARKLLEGDLKQLGEYVNSVANGDEEILEKSGFPLSKVPRPHGPIPATDRAGVSVHSGIGFDIWAEVPNKDYYGVLFAFTEASNPDANPANWSSRYTPVPKITIKDGFVRGKEYKFAVAFVGTSETVNWFKLRTCISPAPVEYTVTFNSNGGSQVASKKVAAGNKVTQPEDPTFGEQNFAGWYSDEELTSLFYFDNVIINKNITLYAKWAVRTYTVTFNTGIGGLTINPVTVNRGDKVAEQKDPTGVYILVWYKDEARSEKFDFNTPITASLTLYATSTIAVTFITLNQTELLNTLIGTQTQLTATVSPENAFNKMLAWSSSNINVATVDVNGAITTHAAGTATITVSSTDGSNISASITIVPHFEIKDAEFKRC
ncbi:hypothetical protein CHS0354_000766 [Potamilus streckersoni]|uniref:BIG2 domain-containing protein n=1 Tax=Potamilus streckersoni TaxID=2493646 RepID=A0AAE0W8K6_9BIVA|nr:hypothetical protein CHS0354_000766 [Potamilus streckersoni]